MPRGFQRAANGANAPVHHVGGGNHIRTGFGMGKRLFNENIHGFVVKDIAAFIDQPVLAMAGEGVQRHVGDDPEFGQLALQFTYRTLRQSIRVVCLGGIVTLGGRRRDREQCHGGHPQRMQFSGFLQQQVDTEAFHTGHGIDSFALVISFEHKQRADQVVAGKA